MDPLGTPDVDLDELFFSFFVIMTKEINLKELKALIKHFKAHECPRLGQRKEILLKFAQEHGLLKKDVPAVAAPVVAAPVSAAPVAAPVVEEKKVVEFKTKAGKTVKIVKKAVKKEKVVKKAGKKEKVAKKKEGEHQEKNAARLKEVQKIRKEKGVSLKEAWALVKKGEPVQEKTEIVETKKEELPKYREPEKPGGRKYVFFHVKDKIINGKVFNKATTKEERMKDEIAGYRFVIDKDDSVPEGSELDGRRGNGLRRLKILPEVEALPIRPVAKKEEPKKDEKIKYVEPNWFKSVNDPEYFKNMTSKERKDSYNLIFGMGEEKFSSQMLPHLKKGYIAWCKRYNKQCHLTKN